ncbi:GH-E family nuclease [Novosphingobium beihaiensis]|uniref:GH-E family nuclease n=1 Tax=Novosphingobium beihaiensis TaxID=2930389 RepID=A0ABT0BPQ3_9SPHN|nr:GH-E family nuclease [Novosphingobium beihaiensis]MCJ2186968.1 GH-E family nuclease [Novosphingobium beihaiensis]
MVAIFAGNGLGLQTGSGSLLGANGLLGKSALGRGNEQVFLNATNGNLMLSRQDEFLVGRGPDLGISRTYNSKASWDGDNGDNWQQSTTRRLFSLTGTINTSGSTIQRTAADGSVSTYTWNGSAYQSTDGSGAYDKLTYSGGVWTWTDGSTQAKETYAAYGSEWRITEAKDIDGNKLTFTYSANKLTKVTTADGSYVSYTWSGNNITQIVTGYTDLATSSSKTLTRVRYTYDTSNRLITATTDLSPRDNSIADGKVYTTSYTYQGTSRRVSTISQTDGSYVSITYDGSGRVTNLTQTASSGVTRVTTISYGSGYTDVTDPAGQTTRLFFDAKGQLTRVQLPPAASGAARLNAYYTYDSNGNVLTAKDTAGGTTTYTYDGHGNILSITDPDGHVTHRIYDVNNRVIREQTTGSFAGGSSVIQNTRYAYDSKGHLRYVIDPEGRVTEYRYDSAGQLNWTTDYPEHPYSVGSPIVSESTMDTWRNGLSDRSSTKVTTYDHDTRGNITSILDYGLAKTDGGATTAGGGSRTYFTYDQAGNLISRHNQGENSETYVYDGLNRLVSSVDLAGGTTTILFTDSANQTKVTTSDGGTVTSTYNRAGELISVVTTGTFVSTGTARYQYDKNGLLRISTDETGYSTYYLYDHLGRKVADISHTGELAEYKYDNAGRVVATARYTNTVSSANLTALANPNNTLEVANVRPAAHSYDIWNWTVYDAAGQVIGRIDGEGGVATYEYDASGRLVKTTNFYNRLTDTALSGYKTNPPLGTVPTPATNARDAVSRIFYDRSGQKIGSLDGEGYLTQIVYDSAGQKTQEIAYAKITNSTYRASGTFNQLKSGLATSSDLKTHYVYDGRLLRYTIDAANNAVGYSYNAAGRQTGSIAYTTAIASTSDYTYDNIKSLVAAIANSTNDHQSWSVYNAKGQLTYAIDATGAVTGYGYDSMGQTIKVTQFAVKRTTTGLPSDATMNSWAASNGTNARITRNYYTGKGELRFVVDAEGYKTRNEHDKAGRLTRTVRWDNAISVSDASTISEVNSAASGGWHDVRYSYDTDGRKISETRGGSNSNALSLVTQWSYRANGTLLAECQAYGSAAQSRTVYYYDNAGRKTQELLAAGTPEDAYLYYTYDGFGNLATYKDARGHTTAYTHDAIGRVLTQTNALGQTTAYEYNAFGDIVKTTDPRGNSSYNYYNNKNQLYLSTDGEGYATRTYYNAFGEVSQVLRYHLKATGTGSTATIPSTPTNGADAHTYFEYDKLGRVTKVTDAEGYHETYVLDAFGNRTSVTNKLGGQTTYTYDDLGQMLTETIHQSAYNSAGTAQATTVVTSYAYDSRGNRTSMVEASNIASQKRTTTYIYDAASRLIETRGDARTVYDQSTHKSSSTSFVPSDKIAYDGRGNIIKTTDAAGNVTTFFYDDLNRKTAQIDPLGVYTSYAYDANGNVTDIKVYENALSSPPATGGANTSQPAAPAGAYRETTFTYDNVNRMLTSTVKLSSAIYTGTWNGSAWSNTATTSLTTSYQHDADGNVVKTTDPNGAAVYAYYDKVGHKTAQVDGEGYITNWSYDGEGNVTSETRFANRYTGTPNVASAPTVAANGANDRTTLYTYDKVGNRKTETRKNVKFHNGSGGTSTGDATVSYTYNGLGQVLTKTEATGDVATYIYDYSGRLALEKHAQFASYAGANVTPEFDYWYDGLGNLVRTNAVGSSGGIAARVTQYEYGKGGLLSKVTDAEGAVHQYFYDKLNRQIVDQYVRTNSAGSTTTEAALTNYDARGQVTEKSVATWNSGSSAWIKGDRTLTQYNAFGQVIKSGINGIWQTGNVYDGAGRLWATTAGDGIWKFFGYDKSGNQTVAISSAGLDMTTFDFSFADALGEISLTNVNATYTVYDKRGLATKVTEEQRQLTASSTQTLNTYRTYNAFGEVTTETNAAGAKISYTYNTMGKLVRSESPTVQITLENGTSIWVKPSEDYYYDKSGRLAAQRDANGTYGTGGTSSNGASKNANTGNLTRFDLLAGSGYGGTEALVTKEYHADGGIKQTKYDIHGDARTLIDEENRTTTQVFDKLGQVVRVNHAGGLVDQYAYDEMGQRLKHWNNQNVTSTATDIERTDYDAQGRVTSTRAFGGAVTNHSYTWDASLEAAGTGLQNTGGWIQVTTMANGKTLTETTDAFGRAISKNDLGGHVTTYTYDDAGRLVKSAVGNASYNYEYYNTGLVKKTYTQDTVWYSFNIPYGGSYQYTNTTQQGATYTYDKAGNRLSEYGTTVSNGTTTVWKNQTATYDALGRIKTINANATTSAPAASTAFEYDANGNIRKKESSLHILDANGAAASSQTTETNWFRFDSMNRLVINNGDLVDGQIVRRIRKSFDPNSMASQELTYNKAGQRTSSAHTEMQPVHRVGMTYFEERENYKYDSAGRLSGTYIAFGGRSTNPDSISAATGDGNLRSTYSYDLMGRQTQQQDYYYLNSNPTYSQSSTYDLAGRLTHQSTSTLKTDGDTYTTSTTNNYGSGSTSALGAVVSSSTASYVNGGSYKGSSTTNSYQWWDGAVQSQIAYDSDTSKSSNTIYHTYFYLNGVGQMNRAQISDGKPRSVTFSLDEAGQIIRRDETKPSNAPSSQTGSPHEVWYRFGDREWGYVGNNGTTDLLMEDSMQERRYRAFDNAGTFRNGRTFAQEQYDFSRSVDPINSYSQGSQTGTHTVKAGETLQSIAQQLYGDSSLWYKIAEANGIQSGTSLVQGQELVLPSGVVRSTFNADSYLPYDPAQAIGDLSPTTPKPPKKHKCGVFGQILLAVVAIAVTAVLKVPVTGLLGGSSTAGLAGAAAAGSIASQSVGLATGIQDKFSFKGVALAALGGAVGGALNGVNAFGEVAKGAEQSLTAIGNAAVRGAIGSVFTQGISTATGLQSKFNWAGVAAAGVAGSAGQALGGGLKPLAGRGANIAGYTGASAAALLAGAATRSAIEGSSFGDNVLAGLPDVIANTIGNLVAEGVAGGGKPRVSQDDIIVGRDAVDQYFGSSGRSFTGAGDGSLEQPVAGVGGGQVGRRGSDASEGEIVVVADPHQLDMISHMTNYQWGAFFGRTGNHYDEITATWALSLHEPIALPSFDGPITQMFKQQGLSLQTYSYGNADYPSLAAYMAAGGQTISTARNLSPYSAAERFNMAMAPLTDSTSGAILYGGTLALGGSEQTALAAHNLGVAIDDAGIGVHLTPRAGVRAPTNAMATELSLGGAGEIVVTAKPYSNPRNRPSYGAGQVEMVWENAQQNGRVFDPNTGELLTWDRSVSRAGQWDMGHLPGQEYRALHGRYMSEEITLKEFLQEYRNPNNYRPESPSSNRSRRYEAK